MSSHTRSLYIFVLLLLAAGCLNLLSVSAAPIIQRSLQSGTGYGISSGSLSPRDRQLVKDMTSDFKKDAALLREDLPKLTTDHQLDVKARLDTFLEWFATHAQANWKSNPFTDYPKEYELLADRIALMSDVDVYVLLEKRNSMFREISKIAGKDGVKIRAG